MSDWPRQFARRIVDGDDRWALIEEFIAWWYGADFKIDGNTDEEIDEAEARIGIKLPTALRRWYRYAGKSLKIVRHQNSFVSLKGLEAPAESYEHLTIFVENQAVVQWAIQVADLQADDPPVEVFDNDEHFGRDSSTLSEFLLFVVISEAMASTGYAAYGDITPDTDLTECFELKREPRDWGAGDEMLYLGPDAIISRQSNMIWARFKSAMARDIFVATVHADWR